MLRLEGDVFRFGTAIRHLFSSNCSWEAAARFQQRDRSNRARAIIHFAPHCKSATAASSHQGGIAAQFHAILCRSRGRNTITTAILGLLLLVLSYRVSQIRRAVHIGLGDGGNADLLVRIRSQANFTEYVPVLLILMALIEYRTGYHVMLGVTSALIIAARTSHAIGMGRPSPNGFRIFGTAATWLSLLILSAWALIIVVTSLG
jgi:uncharacterized protein